MNDPGFVYALINPSMEGLVKVGKTNRDPKGRANELSGATGVPTPFILAYSAPFENCTEAEKMIHIILETKCERISDKREFFKAELNEVIETILDVKGSERNSYINSINRSEEDLSFEKEVHSESDESIWKDYLILADNHYYGHGVRGDLKMY